MARKIDFTTEIVDFLGEPVINRSVNIKMIVCPHCKQEVDLHTVEACLEEQPMTLRLIAVKALTTPTEKISGGESYERYRFALRVSERDEVELTDKEVARLKDLIGDGGLFAPLVVGRAWDILEPELDE